MYVLIPVYYAASCGEYNPKRDLKPKYIKKAGDNNPLLRFLGEPVSKEIFS